MTDNPDAQENRSWLDRPIFSFFPALTGEMLIFIIIILLTATSRLTNLGQRAMSHDENLHTWFSWLYSQGQGYQHTPLMHGPLIFHLTAFTFLMLGSSDFTARLPEALSSILTVVLLWKWRRYLGRSGTLIAAALLLISPLMLYYGRYARNEAFVALFGVLTLYAILRYFETGRTRYLVLLTVATALHFSSKETAFIYTAQALLFLSVYLINRVARLPWRRSGRIFTAFLVTLSIGTLLVGAALGITAYDRAQTPTDASQTAAPIVPGQSPSVLTVHVGPLSLLAVLFALAILAFLAAAILMTVGYGLDNLRRERSFIMLILLGTFVLPQLAAFPVAALGWNPLDYQFTWPGWNLAALWAQTPVRTAFFFVLVTALSIVIGMIWDKKRWFAFAGLFWGIYIVFFTSIFSYWQGFFTGAVGSLGYWIAQQGVHRGGQPWYYYLLILIPVYEFLPAIGLVLAAWFGFRRRSPTPILADLTSAGQEVDVPPTVPASALSSVLPFNEGNFTFPLLLWWSLSSLLAFTFAGEKMPWLTVHIALPFILLTGWALGQVVERLDWGSFRIRRGSIAALLAVISWIALAGAAVMTLGANPPFQGKTLAELTATGSFLFVSIVAIASVVALVYLLSAWKIRDVLRLTVLAFFVLLGILTVRTSYRAAFVNYDNAMEYIVYAHGATGIQEIMDQIQTISSRIAGGTTLQIAYDNNTSDSVYPNKQGLTWSFKWYLRNYPNATMFDQPDDSLRNYPVIIVDSNNFEKIKPIVGTDYYQLSYIRMVWPNQDYFKLKWSDIKFALTNRDMRAALFQIWLNRDFTDYARVTGKTGLTLSDWWPSDKMELFVRKDIAAKVWEYGIRPAAAIQPDPYEGATVDLASDLVVGSADQLNAPRGLAILPNGDILVADSRNNRIQQYDQTGALVKTWGQASPGCPYPQLPPAQIPLGTFCEPWDVAVSPDGHAVYVADTWNHRIQEFTIDGTPIKAWGTPNYDPVSSGPDGLWGPRGIAVDSRGRVFVADTGNKRVVIYDSDGNFLFKFGGSGLSAGQLEEPVGLAVDPVGTLYVADTWNQRVQVFTPSPTDDSYTPASQWTIVGWNGESLDNKPYLALDRNGHIFVTDPEDFRVLEFTTSGDFVRTWGSYGSGTDNFGLASGIVVDSQGRVWVSDSANNRILRFTLP